MVRSAVDRAFLPAKSLFEQVGDMMILTAKTMVSAVRPPYPYGGEFISQFLFALQLCWFPMLISCVAFGFGAPGLQAANFLSLFGALDRLGGFFILASIREFAPFVTAVVVAGVAGTAITADLGARKIREELDALQVLGVDPIKNLVVPRFLALMLITGLLDIYALIFGITGGIGAELLYNQPLGGFFATLFSQRLGHGPLGVGPQVHPVRGDHRRRLLLQGDDCVRRRRRRRPRRQRGGRDRLPRSLCLQLRIHPDAAGDAPRAADDPMSERPRCPAGMAVPRGWLDSTRARSPASAAAIMGLVYSGRVFDFFGESLRQAGILILGSAVVIWGLIFIIGLAVRARGRLPPPRPRRPRLRRRLHAPGVTCAR